MGVVVPICIAIAIGALPPILEELGMKIPLWIWILAETVCILIIADAVMQLRGKRIWRWIIRLPRTMGEWLFWKCFEPALSFEISSINTFDD